MTKELLMSLYSRWLHEQSPEKIVMFSEANPHIYLPAFASGFQILALSYSVDEFLIGVVLLSVDYDPLLGMCIKGWFKSDNSIIDIWHPTAKVSMSEYPDITGIDCIMNMLLKHRS